MNSRWFGSCVVIVSGLLVCQAGAVGYTLERSPQGNLLRWHRDRLQVGLVGELPPELDQAAVQTAVLQGFDVWCQVDGVGLEVEPMGYAGGPLPDAPSQGEILVGFVMDGWTGPEDSPGITRLSYNAATGELVAALVLLNAESYQWSTDGSVGMDVQNVVAHEAGHALGMGHSIQVEEATMYPRTKEGETSKRDLHPDDMAGIQVLYGHRDRGDEEPIPVGASGDVLATPMEDEGQDLPGLHPTGDDSVQVTADCSTVPSRADALAWLGTILLVLGLLSKGVGTR